MTRYLIIFKRKECIGAAACEAVSPKLWRMHGDGKAELKGATVNPRTGDYELEIDAALFEEQRTAAESCPSGCIRVVEA